MNFTTRVAMFGWIPAVLVLFALLPPRRAVIVGVLFAWLFLPMARFHFEGLPPYTKVSATTLVILLGAAVFDAPRVLAFRPSWVDLPMAAWCIAPFLSSVANGLGIKDGVLEMFNQTVAWGVPFFLGRLYFGDLNGLRELAIGVFISGVIYIPFCLWEVRMSPRLHRVVYGYHQSPFRHHLRFGGYRPRVFMHSGLALGMWMTAASVAGVWLWTSGALRHLWRVPMSLLAPALVTTTVLCKAFGAILLLILGLGVMIMTKLARTSVLIVALIAIPVIYVNVRATGLWSGQAVIPFFQYIDAERAASFAFRLENEDLLAVKAWQQPVLGWGGWRRNRVLDERGRDLTTTDGLWIITFGQRGLVGLVALMVTLLLPAALLLWRIPGTYWSHASVAGAACLAVIVVLYAIDNLMNAQLNPIFMLAGGGICGAAVTEGWRYRS